MAMIEAATPSDDAERRSPRALSARLQCGDRPQFLQAAGQGSFEPGALRLVASRRGRAVQPLDLFDDPAQHRQTRLLRNLRQANRVNLRNRKNPRPIGRQAHEAALSVWLNRGAAAAGALSDAVLAAIVWAIAVAIRVWLLLTAGGAVSARG